VSIPASCVSVWYGKSRRVRAATRRLTGETLEVEFSIDVPLDSASDVPDVVDAEASLKHVSIMLFTSMLQDHMDSSFGDGVHVVSVFGIEVVAVDVRDGNKAGSSDSRSPLLLFVCTCGALCCLACPFTMMTLLSRRRPVQALRPEKAKIQVHRDSTGCIPPAVGDASWWVPPEDEAPSCQSANTAKLLVADDGGEPTCTIC